VSDSVIEGQAMTKDSGAAPKVQQEEPEEEQTMGDIVAPFERTRAKRVDTAASDDEQVETPNEAAMSEDNSSGWRGWRPRNLRLFFCQNSDRGTVHGNQRTNG